MNGQGLPGNSSAKHVAIIICTFNRAESLRKTLESLSKLLVPAGMNAELIVVDNNSTDHTKEICAAACPAVPLRCISERSQGQAHAQNRALSETAAPLLLFTDDDVVVDPQWLTAYWEAAQRYPDAGFFGGPVQPIWETPPPGWFVKYARTLLAHVAVHFDRGPSEGPLAGAVGANMGIRRSAMEGLRFDTRLGRQNEVHLMKEIRARGVTGVYLPAAVIQHQTYPERMTERYVRRWYVGDGREEVLRDQVLRSHPWFGVDRYYWKQFVLNALRYAFTRWLAPASVWLPAEMQMAKSWGVISECRRSRMSVSTEGKP